MQFEFMHELGFMLGTLCLELGTLQLNLAVPKILATPKINEIT